MDKKECYNCDEKINDNEICVTQFGDIYCKYCYDTLCKKCKKFQLHKCWGCRKVVFCLHCDDGEVHENSWDCVDIYKCKQCRELRLEELYEYIVDTYNEKLSLKEIKYLLRNKK